MENRNNARTAQRVLIAFVILIIAWGAELVFFYNKIDDVKETCAAMAQKEAETAERLKEMERIAAYNKNYIDQLLKNREFLEMEARSRLGVAVPGEVVIREENSERREPTGR